MSIVYSGDKITFGDGSTLGSGWTGFKNRIINGAMRIDQRNAGASVTLNGSSAYPLDRFKAFGRVAGGATAQRSSTAPAGFSNSLLYTVTSGATPDSGDYPCIQYYVEGLDVSDLGWGTADAQPITISFKARSSVTGTYAFSLRNSGGTRSYVAQYTINSANTWESKSITVAGDTTGTWLTTNGIGIELMWDMGFGFGNTTTSNTWLAGNSYRLSSNVSLVATTGATFYITGVQLEKGSTATSFDYRPYGTELALCQRYCIRLTDSSNAFTMYGLVCGGAGTDKYGAFSGFNMRATPTITSSTLQSAGAAVADITSVNSFGSTSTGVIPFYVTFATSQPQGAYFIQNKNSTSAFIQFSAEL